MTQALSRAVAAFRLLAVGYAAILVITDHHRYSRPNLAWLLLGVMVAWTVVTVALALRISQPMKVWLAIDVAVGAGMVLATAAIEPHARIVAGAPTLPAAWAAAPVLACAVSGGPLLGGLAGVAISVADVVERGGFSQHTFNGVVLLLMAGVVGGYVVRLGQQAEATIAAAARRDAAVAERDRLAREIHDSTLQVLALVARRGASIGGEASELARLATEQEIALRQLMTSAELPGAAAAGIVDLRPLLTAAETSRVTVAVPAEAVMLPEHVASAIAAAVSEALANVDRHAGATARAWVLLEAMADSVVVSVRDDGVGIAAGRLDAARDGGRFGVAQSIIGRIVAVGGTATLTSSPGAGTEVEINVPR